ASRASAAGRRAMAVWASCKVANPPAARRRFASSFRWRKLGRAGSVRDGSVLDGGVRDGSIRDDGERMAALPSRPGSARVGRERLAVDRSYTTGELAALPADPEAAGTTKADDTP